MEQAQVQVKTLSAGIEQKISLRGALQSQELIGKVILEKPNKLYLTFEKPTAQTFISDGKRLYLYTPALKQAIVQDASASPLLKQFEFAWGQEKKKMIARFNVSKLTEENIDGDRMHVLKLTPRHKKIKNYYEAKLWVRESDWLLVKSVAYTTKGGLLTMKLKNIKINPEVKPDQFIFKPPVGVEVVDGLFLLDPTFLNQAAPAGKK